MPDSDESDDLRAYIKRSGQEVLAIQLQLDTEGFTYEKWGATQRCKPGDWLVQNGDDVYTVDGETFTRTYTMVTPGSYRKTTPVWVTKAETPGTIKTKEGATSYAAGDYIVYNHPDGKDGYAVSANKFEVMYEPKS